MKNIPSSYAETCRKMISNLLSQHDHSIALLILSCALYDRAYAIQDGAECDDDPPSAARKNRLAACVFDSSSAIEKLANRARKLP